jgi:predicted nucleic acid-binding protein
MQGTPIEAMDMFIAASTKSKGAILVTNNGKHFLQIQDLVTEYWASAENIG